MHDIDRTQAEWEFDGQELEYEYETNGYSGYEMEGVFDEAEEMELAVQALEITDEAELDQFIGNLIKRAGRALGSFVRSPMGQQLGGMLKQAAAKALPAAGAAIGARFGSPQMGAQIASTAGQMFGLELEGMSGEDQEFEVARQFVRFAGDAVKNATTAGPNTSPQAAARNAIVAAAQQYAPGLLRDTSSPKPTNGAASLNGGSSKQAQSGRRTGRWIRQGNRIVLYGV